MKNIAIVSDSSISFTNEEIKEYKLYTVPIVIMHDNKTFYDQQTITNNEVNDLLDNKVKITTSQPVIGQVIEKLEQIQKKNYDHIFILTISSKLSGTFNVFNQAAKQINLENYSIIDSKTIAGPVQQGVKAIVKMNKEGKSIQEITSFLDKLFDDQVSYLYPKSLEQVVASGRVSKSTAKIVALLKIKTVVYLKKQGESIEQLGIARTDKKIFDIIIKSFKENNVSPDKYDLYFLESKSTNQLENFKAYLFNKLGEFKHYTAYLPASLSVHAGSEAMVVQWCLKI